MAEYAEPAISDRWLIIDGFDRPLSLGVILNRKRVQTIIEHTAPIAREYI